MTRRILLIILAAVALALLVGSLWFWFFSGTGAPAPQGGTFGTGTDKTGTTGSNGGQNNNIPSGTIGAGSGANTSAGSGGSAFNNGATGAPSSVGIFGTTSSVGGVGTVPGVDWVGGPGGVSGLGGPTTSFVPKTVNQLNTDSVGGTPGFLSTGGVNSGSSNNGSALGLAGIGVAAGGCAIMAAIKGTGELEAGAKGAASLATGFVLVYDFNVYAKQATKENTDLTACLMRTVVKAVLDQMTNSIVNWINSGFNGKPSFVTNFQQYFTNVGDQAAGEFIRGTALSFLCSPFQLKIKIAIAQSYARRNNAAACTLTGISKNITAFTNGNFGQGGWGSLLQLTTVPTNNPYGAYAYAQIGLATAQNNAINNANRNLTPNGFISIQKCDTQPAPGPNQNGSAGVPQNCKIVTPGKVVEETLASTLQTSSRTLELAGVAGNIDAIVSALVTQLTTRALYQGFSSLSGVNGYAGDYLTPQQQQSLNTAQTMLRDMQGRQQVAQQYGSIAQGAVGDIQNTQQQLQTLVNCYETKDKMTEATSTLDVLHAYDSQVDAYNAKVTQANQAIATLQALQTQTLNVATPQDVAVVQASYQQAINSGALITSVDVTNAQQDRTTLQSNLAGRNQATQSALQQCNAL